MAAARFAVTLLCAGCAAPPVAPPASTVLLDIGSVARDLTVPAVRDGAPKAGDRVRVTAPEYQGTDVHHLLYLPTDWAPGKRFPVIVEYAGNGPYRNRFGDVSTGRVEGSNLGFGISGGEGFIWICLPYVAVAGRKNQRQWWGDVAKTVAYCKAVVPRVCREYGGDPSAVFLVGFSRGAIACNFIGLHDADIAKLWCGFICHSHYDGVRRWPYTGSDRIAAARRLARLGDRPQWISHERSVEETRRYLAQAAPDGRFTLRRLPFRNHTDEWVLRNFPLRRELRAWVRRACSSDAGRR
jgi:hypothetical protein